MHESSQLPDRFTAAKMQQAETILARSEMELISCLWWRMDIRDVVPRRRLGDSYLFFPTVGRLWCRIGPREQVIGPGEFMMVAEGVEHEARLAEDCNYFEAYAIHTHAYTTHGQPLFEVFSTPIGRIEPPAPWFGQLELLTHLMGTTPSLGRMFGEAWLRTLLLMQLAQGNTVQTRPAADDRRLWEAVDHILNHYASPLQVPALARQAGLSDVQFRKRFKQYTGCSPKAYIQQLRLRKARALLQTNPQATIKEVASQTGFGDPHYLHAVFKQVYGTAPAACRRPPEA